MMTRKTTVILAACCVLAACGDPLDRVEKLSDVTLADQDTTREALASPEELARDDRGVLGGLFNREPASENAPEGAAAVLPADAQGELVTEGDGVEVAALPAEQTESAPRRSGLFGLVRRVLPGGSDAEPNSDTSQTTETSEEPGAPTTDETVVADAEAEPETTNEAAIPEVAVDEAVAEAVTVPQDAEKVAEPQTEVASAETEVASVEPAPRRGVLAGLFRPHNADREDTAVAQTDTDPEQDTAADVQVASLTPEAEITPAPTPEAAAAEPARRGLFGQRRATSGPRNKPRIGPDARDVEYGTVLAFGEVARVCDARNKPMGRKIEQAGRGKGFVLYDSVPDSTGPRTFYVTGFDDNCPRQFTAALALFGAPSMHEQLRYGRPSDIYPYSTTDKAYEKVKSAICGAARRKPCGNKIDTLERNTVFISAYERFTNNGRWADILLHDGAVLAAALKDP